MVKALILHGGAGAWRSYPAERVEEAKKTIGECAKRGWIVLEEGNDAVKAVIESVKCMEDSGVLNAGWGSVLDLLGDRSLDAGIMSSTGLIGGVGGVKATRNPIILAYIVATETPHILLVGEGADMLARLKNLPPLPPPPERLLRNYSDLLKKLLKKESTRPYIDALWKFLDHNPDYLDLLKKMAAVYDTVGACAVDDKGVLAAGVSTGGLFMKIPGRVGDSAIPGAGFYASNNTACSATGIGEKIIVTMPCRKLDEVYSNTPSLSEAADKVIDYVNKQVGSDTLGFIAVDHKGEVVWRYNTEAMLVARVIDGSVEVYL